MVELNLLPYRAENRKQSRQRFYLSSMSAGLMGIAIICLAGLIINAKLAQQYQRTQRLLAANQRLEQSLHQMAALQQQINVLQQRQQSIAHLQQEQNDLTHLLEDLARQTPHGVYLRLLKQEAQSIVINGYAQSQEPISILLRKLDRHLQSLEQAELQEVRLISLNQADPIYAFTIRAHLPVGDHK